MSAPGAETLLGLLVELDRIRSLAVELLERSAPQLQPVPGADPQDGGRTAYELLAGARRAVIGNPAAARELYDLLVAEGRHYAETEAGAQLRDTLVRSEAVGHLRRIWETVSLNVLDGPAAATGVPDAWAELLADAVTGRGLDDAVLARLRPKGFA